MFGWKNSVMGLVPWLALSLWLGACAPPVIPVDTAAPSPGVTLTPFVTRTPQLAITLTPTLRHSPTPLPTPTPTPFTYTIVEGDTLLGIAFKFGIQLEALLAANPGIDPQFLRIGDALIIPLDPDAPAAGIQSTPAGSAAPVGAPACYPAADGSAWCLWLVANTGDTPLENLSAQVTVYDDEGEPLDTRSAIPPVNVVPARARLPLLVWFPPQAEAIASVNAVLQSALAVPAGDTRYLGLLLRYEAAISRDRASVSGEIQLTGETPASEIWIALVAYGANGEPLGARRIALSGTFTAGVALLFSGEVFGLGGEVVGVEVFAEAFPIPPVP
jgi:LysM repeat protein